MQYAICNSFEEINRMENAGYLFAAFTLIWALVFGYVLVLFNRQRRMRREIDLLKEAFKKEQVEQ